MDTKGLQKEFINWCKSKNKQPKNEDETKQLFVAFMKEKHPEEYKQAIQNQQKQQQAQAQKALHGAKLNYFKSLKNQCAEDEEVVYYKKGGLVNCGCKKKEEGGQVNKASIGGVVERFKNRAKDTLEQAKARAKYKPDYSSKKVKDSEKDYLEGKGDHKVKEKCGGKVKKNEDGSKIKKNCGGAVAKFKMHRQGGKIQFSF